MGSRSKAPWVWGLVVLLAILHQDFWQWNSQTLWFGFLPAVLGYHALFSLACGGVWFLATRWAWPTHLERWSEERTDGERSS